MYMSQKSKVDYDTKYEEYDALDDTELKKEIEELIKSKSYEENDFTEMTRDIANRDGELSEKQRRVLINHLIYNS